MTTKITPYCQKINAHQLIFLSVLAILLFGCSLAPSYKTPTAPIPANWPTGAAYSNDSTKVEATDIDWQHFFKDEYLQTLIKFALENNRDLKLAALNVDAYRAQYKIQRASTLPAINANGQEIKMRALVPATNTTAISSNYTVGLGVTAFELDFLGHIQNLKSQALEQYFAGEAAHKNAAISLSAAVASSYFQLLADTALLESNKRTLENRQAAVALLKKSLEIGQISAQDLSQAQTSLEIARANLAAYTRQVAQDENALILLLGGPLPTVEHNTSFAEQKLATLPSGLPSDLLTRRPDILEAEHNLKAANANIGAARAAFFPKLTLTGNYGFASNDLTQLFKAGLNTWAFQPIISMPIFDSGSNSSNLDLANVQKNISIAKYEKTIQIAFQEVANGLAAQNTYGTQMGADEGYLNASKQYHALAKVRYEKGLDSMLTLLDAERALYTAEQTYTHDKLAYFNSLITLYKALGGGWKESL